MKPQVITWIMPYAKFEAPQHLTDKPMKTLDKVFVLLLALTAAVFLTGVLR